MLSEKKTPNAKRAGGMAQEVEWQVQTLVPTNQPTNKQTNNYKIWMKEVVHDTNKWKGIPMFRD
jgi:hypothetical protein